MKITNFILKSLIIIGLAISMFNTGLFLITEKTIQGFSFERKLFWITFLLCFFGVLFNTEVNFKKRFFLISIIVLLITQFIIIGNSGIINADREIRINKEYVLKTGTTLITMPYASIYRTESLFEKEVTKRGGIKYELEFDNIDSMKIKEIDKNKIALQVYMKDTLRIINFKWKNNN